MNKDAPAGQRTGNLYDVLQVSPSASQEVIHAAYRALARSYHPDVNPSAAAAQCMLRLNAAYDVLGDAQRRARYDLKLVRTRRPAVTAVARHPAPAGVRGRAGPGAPRRVEDERAARTADVVRTGARAAGRPRVVLVVVCLVVLAVSLYFALWLVSTVSDDNPPGVLHSERRIVEARSLGTHLPLALAGGVEQLGSAQPLLNRG